MSKFKGLGFDMVFLAFVVVLGCLLVYLILVIFGVAKIVHIGGKVDILLKMSDEGTNILSFLNARNGDFTHAEIVGAFEAPNMPQALDADVNATLRSFQNYYFKIKGESGEMKKQSEDPKKMSEIDAKVPLPNGKGGIVELVVW